MPQPVRKPPPSKRSRAGILWFAIGLVILVAGGWWWHSRAQGDAANYRTAVVDRGTIAVSISATGNLSAITTVDVGAQVSGIVQSVLVDYNDRVTKGQIIAHIDPSPFNAKVQQAQGQVAAAQAQLGQAQAGLVNTQVDYKRKADLGQRQLIARSDVDAALALRDQGLSAVASGRAQIAQQQAALDSAKLDLEHSVIRSPVDGVVITRAVEPGQTVAASLQTPTLFQIAEDLRQMQIILAVDEADIGQVKVGQNVRFNVDAFPDRDFSGVVKQIRLGATNTQNVISYPVVVTVNNDDLTLLPGMTVNAEIQISRHDNVLRVPNAALRFHPADATASAGAGASPAAAKTGGGMTDELPKIAAQLHLDATQQAAFDQAMAAMAERAKEQKAKRDAANAQGSTGASLFGGARPPGGTGGQGGQGGNGQGQGGARGGGQNAQRMIARMSQQFAAFHATLRPDQQQTWDAALQGLAGEKRATVYKLVDGKAQAASIRVGASDGSFTEASAGVAEGDKVITGLAPADAAKQ
jgi:HlyD family secretion protein